MIDALVDYQAKRARGEVDPPAQGTPWSRFEAKNTRKTAIDAMCARCMGWSQTRDRPPGVRRDVAECSDTGCPLHEWRPWK